MISQIPKTTPRSPRLLLYSSRDARVSLRIINHEKDVPVRRMHGTEIPR